MTFPPIVARELRELARGVRFHWGRAVVAGFAVVLCLQWFSAELPGMNRGQLGLGCFHMLGWLGFVLALSTCVVTSDCVSHERREGTLGLLFLTTLKGYDVVLGKFTAMGTVAFYALLGFTPMLMLPLMVGGVTGDEVARVAVVLLNLTFVSLATGLWVSVHARNQFAAILSAVVVLAFICLAPFFLQVVTHDLGGIPFAVLSPAVCFLISADAPYTASPGIFWGSLGICHLEGWLFILAAAHSLQKNWRQVHKPRVSRGAVPQARRLVGAPRVVVMGHGNRKRTFAPVARALLQLRGVREMAWLGAVVSVIGSLCSAFMMNRLGSVWAAATVGLVFTLVSSGLFAFVGGRFFYEARRSGELELLLVTPVGAKGILREQRLALLRVLRAPLVLVLAGAIAVGAVAIRIHDGRELLGMVIGLCATANAVLVVLPICWVGMWFGTRVNSPFAIVGCTIGLVEVVPTVLVYLLPVLLAPQSLLHEFWPLVAGLFLVCKNIFFLLWAQGRLRAEFPASAVFQRPAGMSAPDVASEPVKA